MREVHVSRGAQNLGIAMLAILVAVGTVVVIQSQPAPVKATPYVLPEPEPTRDIKPFSKITPAKGAIKVGCLGDSFPGGGTVGGFEKAYCGQLAKINDWQLGPVLSSSGGGYINKGAKSNLPSLLGTGQLKSNPVDVVIVQAGNNDRRYKPTRVAGAAIGVVNRIKFDSPKTQVVVIGIFAAREKEQKDKMLGALNRALASAAKSSGALFLDPRIEPVTFPMGPDAFHPSEEGHRAIAQWITAEMTKAKAF